MLGVTVTDIDQTAPASAPTDTGQWLAAGLADRGPVAAAGVVTNLSQVTALYGPRVSCSVLYDSIETFFREGGGVAYIGRVVGPAAAVAQVTLQDNDPAPSIIVRAVNPGAWGNSLNAAVVAGSADGTFVLVVNDDVAGELERSPDLTSAQDAADWAAASRWVRVSVAGDEPPVVVGATSLAGGSDDRVSITDAQWQTALNLFDRTLGPGQISAPGRTTAVGHAQLIARAAATNRVALLDAPDTGVVATLLGSADAIDNLPDTRFAALLGSWVSVPGILPSTVRTVPGSAFLAGLIARSDAVASPNQPAAGENGIARWALAPAHRFSDADHQTLNGAAVNMSRIINSQLRAYGYRSLEAKSLLRWWQFSNSRLRMAIQAQLEQIGESYMFRQIDGRGVVLATLAGQIRTMLLGHYAQDALSGDTPEQAFRVDVSDAVNPPAELAAGRVNAVAVIRPSPFGEEIVISLVRQSITEPV